MEPTDTKETTMTQPNVALGGYQISFDEDVVVIETRLWESLIGYRVRIEGVSTGFAFTHEFIYADTDGERIYGEDENGYRTPDTVRFDQVVSVTVLAGPRRPCQNCGRATVPTPAGYRHVGGAHRCDVDGPPAYATVDGHRLPPEYRDEQGRPR